MYQRGIRGAITITDNTAESVKSAVVELISEIKNSNNFKEEDVSHIIFTMTKDTDCIYPAKILREEFPSWQYVPMMCVGEMDIAGSLEHCLRVLIVINTDMKQNEIKHVYLKGASILRKDLSTK